MNKGDKKADDHAQGLNLKDYIDALYVPRRQGRIGLACNEDSVYASKRVLDKKIKED